MDCFWFRLAGTFLLFKETYPWIPPKQFSASVDLSEVYTQSIIIVVLRIPH